MDIGQIICNGKTYDLKRYVVADRKEIEHQHRALAAARERERELDMELQAMEEHGKAHKKRASDAEHKLAVAREGLERIADYSTWHESGTPKAYARNTLARIDGEGGGDG